MSFVLVSEFLMKWEAPTIEGLLLFCYIFHGQFAEDEDDEFSYFKTYNPQVTNCA